LNTNTIRLAYTASAIAIVLGMSIMPSAAQDASGQESVGRGWPLGMTEELMVGAGGPGAVAAEARAGNPNQQAVVPREDVVGTSGGEVPEGVTPLERDIFTSDDFYADQELWSDPLYFRCNSPMALESMWGAYGARTQIGENFPETVSWGHCDRDYPREDIVSPYPFETAKEHYEALMAETEANGGVTEHTMATVPNWTGRYDEDNTGYPQWFHMNLNQAPTILSLLTPEYQMRTMQETYHQANTNAAQWPSSYCMPEGLLRWYTQPAVRMFDFMVTDQKVLLMAGVADNFMRQIMIGKTMNEEGAVPRLGEDVPRWYGETVGFWDDDALITWTSNVQGWTTHSAFEHSNQLQLVEIYTPRQTDAGELEGVLVEAIFYDPEALVEPIRMHRFYKKASDLNAPDAHPYVFVECIQTIYPIEGRATPTTPGQVIEYKIPDMYGRPWAQIWEEFHEEGMTPPEATEGLFGF
jgi:hypothetical protein